MIQTLVIVLAIVAVIFVAWLALRGRAVWPRWGHGDGLDRGAEAKLSSDRIAERLRTLGAQSASREEPALPVDQPLPVTRSVTPAASSVDRRERLVRDTGYALIALAALVLLASSLPSLGDPGGRPGATHVGIDQGARPSSESAASTASPAGSAGGAVAGETFVPVPSATAPMTAGATPRPTPRRTPGQTGARPTSTPTAGPTPSGVATPQPSLTAPPTPSPDPTPPVTPTPAPTPEPTPDATPDPTPSPSP
jgi:hypothetical protein